MMYVDLPLPRKRLRGFREIPSREITFLTFFFKESFASEKNIIQINKILKKIKQEREIISKTINIGNDTNRNLNNNE